MFLSQAPTSKNDIAKTQDIRTLDVWIIGPMMIMGGRCLGGTHGGILKLMGYGTVIYNWANHYKQATHERGE